MGVVDMTAHTMPMPTTPASEPHGPALASDETLVGLLRDGDTLAGEMLVKKHYEALIRYLQRLTGTDGLAEELHQQTWVSALDHLARFDVTAPGGFKAWLFRIATNKANDHWRACGRERNAKEGLMRIAEHEAPQAGQHMEASEEEEKLRRGIAQLPEPQRQVLLLRYYSNLKFSEIADVLGCPLNTALGRMHKAMLKLKEFMEAQETQSPARA